RQARARPDREVRGTQRVADEDAVADRPVLVANRWKAAPDRLVGDQRVPLQGAGKGRFDRRPRLRVVHRLEAGALPGGSVAFGDEGAHPRPVTVVVRVHRPEWRIDERLAQRIEGARRALPDEAVGEELEARVESGIMKE